MKIELNEKHCRPFGRLEGTVDPAGQSLDGAELRLFWQTRGRGTEETGVVASKGIDPRVGGRIRFYFDLPSGPYSVSGKLVSLAWAVELVDGEGNGLVLEEFVLAPDGREIVLGVIKKPKSGNKWSQVWVTQQ